MNRWSEITLGDVAKGVSRYRPFIAIIAAMVLVATLLGGADDGQLATGGFEPEFGTDGAVTGGPTEAGESATGAGTPARSGFGSATDASADGRAAQTGQPLAAPQGAGPDCDPATGRVRIPSRFAPPCKPIVPRGSGGATSQGVSADTITLVYYRIMASPAATAAITAAGLTDNWEDVQDTIKVYADLLNHHWNLQGRKIDMKIFEGTADADDDAAGRADAIALADRYKPFAVLNSVNNAMVDELVARKIICICTTSLPQEFYERRAPYAGWTTLMSSTQGYVHRAEFVCKRLARRNARWAGFRDTPADPMSDEARVFGLLYYETPDRAYKSGVDFFQQELARCGVRLKAALAYPSDLVQAQEQSRSLIARLKSDGVTSVIFSGDPINPATFTNEANKQRWQPEWIITGSALTDWTLFARTYNQDQWSRAFGISYLSLRGPEANGDSYKLHVWHAGRPPRAANAHAILWAPFFAFATGIHMAGPTLTPLTFAEGMFAYPVSGIGMVTAPTASYGRHGLWDRAPWNMTDYTLYDDATEIWWDREATGPDEAGNNGVGMYRYVNNGKRYLPREHPTSDTRAFDRTNAPTILTEVPPSDRAPNYEHKHYYTQGEG